jgi:hypothetical protein
LAPFWKGNIIHGFVGGKQDERGKYLEGQVAVVFVIDRFEGDWAVIELDRLTFNIPKVLLPEGAREGDVIEIKVSVNKKATAKRRKTAQKMMNELFEG